MKLSKKQIEVIEVLRKYDCMIMYDGWVTGGHGYRCNKNTTSSLERMDIIKNGRLTEKGKIINRILINP